MNWAIKKVSSSSDWILRIDADEIINESQLTIIEYLSKLDTEINGLNVRRNIFLAMNSSNQEVFTIKEY